MKKKIAILAITIFLFLSSCAPPTPGPIDATTAAKLYYTGVYHACYKVATEANRDDIPDPVAYCDKYLETALDEDWFNDQTLPAPPVMIPNAPPEG